LCLCDSSNRRLLGVDRSLCLQCCKSYAFLWRVSSNGTIWSTSSGCARSEVRDVFITSVSIAACLVSLFPRFDASLSVLFSSSCVSVCLALFPTRQTSLGPTSLALNLLVCANNVTFPATPSSLFPPFSLLRILLIDKRSDSDSLFFLAPSAVCHRHQTSPHTQNLQANVLLLPITPLLILTKHLTKACYFNLQPAFSHCIQSHQQSCLTSASVAVPGNYGRPYPSLSHLSPLPVFGHGRIYSRLSPIAFACWSQRPLGPLSPSPLFSSVALFSAPVAIRPLPPLFLSLVSTLLCP